MVAPLTLPLPAPGTDRSVTATYSVRALSDLTTEIAAVDASSLTWDDPENVAGPATLVVADDDPNIGTLVSDAAVVVALNGTDAFTLIVDQLEDTVIASGEEAVEATSADCRLLCSILDRVRAKPTRGYSQKPWSDSRTFSFASLEYVPTPAWVTATELSSSQTAPTMFYKGLPVGWFDPSAKWIAPSTGDDTQAQTGIWYTYGDFTLAQDTDLVLIFAADNAALVFFDGFQISDISTDVGFGQTTRYTIRATAGTHRIAARVANYVQTTVTDPPFGGSAVDPGNPTAFICACFAVDNRGALGALVIHTDALWSMLEFPNDPPGMSIRQIARIILEENQADSAGLLPLVSITGTDIRDTDGQLWPLYEFITVDVGRSLLQLLSDWSGLYCDWAMPGPTSMDVSMWLWHTRGGLPAASYAQTADPDTSSLDRLARTELAIVADALQVRWAGGWLRVPDTGGTKVGVIKPAKASTVDEATRIATQVLALYSVVREMWTGDVRPTTAGDIPYVDFAHADMITLAGHYERTISIGGDLTDDGIRFRVQTKDPVQSAVDRIETMLAQLADGTLGGAAPASPSGPSPKFGVDSGSNQQTWSAPDPLTVGMATKIDVFASSGNLFQLVLMLATVGSTDTTLEFLCDFGAGYVDVLGGGGVIPAGAQVAIVPVDYLGLSTVFIEGLDTIQSINITGVGTSAAGLTVKPVWL